MPAITITIGREQRDGIYELVRNDLGSIGDLWDALERKKDFATAERLSIEFREDFELLDDLGWAESDSRSLFALRIPKHDLMEALRRLRGDAARILAGAEGSREDARTNERFQQGHDACSTLLSALDLPGG